MAPHHPLTAVRHIPLPPLQRCHVHLYSLSRIIHRSEYNPCPGPPYTTKPSFSQPPLCHAHPSMDYKTQPHGTVACHPSLPTTLHNTGQWAGRQGGLAGWVGWSGCPAIYKTVWNFCMVGDEIFCGLIYAHPPSLLLHLYLFILLLVYAFASILSILDTASSIVKL